MSGKDQEQQLITSNQPSSMKRKLVIASVTFLAVVAVAAVVCVVALTANSDPNSMEVDNFSANRKRSTVVTADSDTDETLLTANHETANTRVTRSASRLSRQLPRGIPGRRNPNLNRDMSCISHPSNTTIPAAHIKGYGGRLPVRNAHALFPMEPNGYLQRWRCGEFEESHRSSVHAFVDGGMVYNQTDKSLRVPTCGYYHIFSQILFDLQKSPLIEGNHSTVYHLLKFERNCKSWPETSEITVLGKSSIHVGELATTYTGDVIKLCAGGRVWVEIPDGPNGIHCCPTGDENATFLGAVLVAETTCHWPPNIEMDNLNNDGDEE